MREASLNDQRQLIIFAGAGASAAVNLDNYPTTVGFRKRLPSEISSNDLFAFVEQFLQHEVKEGASPFDIEKVLWALQELVKDLSFFHRQNSLTDYLIRTGYLGSLTGKRSDRLSLIIDTAPKLVEGYSDLWHIRVEKRGFSNFSGDGLLSASLPLKGVFENWLERKVVVSAAS